MKAPATPANEAARLQALASYEVLDTGPEASFDALTRLASAILEVPIALVSLIDADRQWFKSRYGLEAPQTPRDVSFCGHVVAAEAPLIVKDAFADARFDDNPLVTGNPRVRFYAGMPLRTPDGFVLGTLCAIDHVPRELTARQLELLTLLAGQVVDQLEARRKRHQLATERAAALDNAQRLRVLIDAMAEGVVVQGLDGVISTANASAERILGLSAEQIAGRSSLDPSWKAVREDGTPFPGEAHPAMATLRTGLPSTNVVMGIHKPGGELTWISINSLPLRHEADGRVYAAVTTFHDITTIKAAQAAADRLARQERLVTTGTLASGVGHEINNPLAAVMGNLDFTVEELKAIEAGAPSPRLREVIDVLLEARAASDRIRKIVKGLRALAREEAAPTPIDVSAVVDIAANMAAHDVRHKASLLRQLGQTPQVLADESRLSQVLVNLMVNAAQAFTTSDLDHNRITVSSALEPNGRVSISVADNGPGIPAGLLRRIFDPFFTTRPVGQGTGLGLSVSQSLVTSLGGELLVESVVGQGARFKVLLPVAPLAVSAGPPAAEAAPTAARGRVLVVDDEAALLATIRRALSREHQVVALTDSREALKLIEGGERFDVVFCDLMMPHLSGDQLYAKVKALDAGLAERFVFISGGATEPRIQKFLAEVPNERVEKPFSVQNLRGIVRRFVGAR